MSFGRRLREHREHRGLSLADLGRATHFSRGYLSNLENDRKPPTEDLARRCDEALRASGELIAAARTEVVARLDRSPWQTAELVQRMQASDTTPATLEALQATIVELCCQYSYRDALDLRQEAQGWLHHVGGLLRRPVGLHAHAELLVAGGWLALLTGCVEYDLGMRAAAESTRTAALQLGTEAGHPEIAGWAPTTSPPDGAELSPMRIGETRVALAVVASREDDLEQAVALGLKGLTGTRQSRPSLIMVASELDHELRTRFPTESLTREFAEAVRAVKG